MKLTKAKQLKYVYYVLLICSVIFLVITNSEFMNKPKQIHSMNITEISPLKILKGTKFNLWNGKAVLIVKGTGFSSDSKLYVNNTELETAYGDEGYITAILPDRFFKKERDLKIQLRAENSSENIINMSNERTIPVVKAKEEQDMIINQISPQIINKNIKFNIWKDQSALIVNGKNFIEGCKVYANDVELDSAFGNKNLITAIVPDKLYTKEGEIQIQVKYIDLENNVNHLSNKITIPIR